MVNVRDFLTANNGLLRTATLVSPLVAAAKTTAELLRARTNDLAPGRICLRARHRLSQNWNFPPQNQKAVSCLIVEKC